MKEVEAAENAQKVSGDRPQTPGCGPPRELCPSSDGFPPKTRTDVVQEVKTETSTRAKRPLISEIYSPPRVTAMARRLGLAAGEALDLSTPEADGYVWDFSRRECRARARKIVQETEPFLIVFSPECTPFSTLQNLNMRTEKGKLKVEAARAVGTKHLEFCCSLMEEQMGKGNPNNTPFRL